METTTTGTSWYCVICYSSFLSFVRLSRYLHFHLLFLSFVSCSPSLPSCFPFFLSWPPFKNPDHVPEAHPLEVSGHLNWCNKYLRGLGQLFIYFIFFPPSASTTPFPLIFSFISFISFCSFFRFLHFLLLFLSFVSRSPSLPSCFPFFLSLPALPSTLSSLSPYMTLKMRTKPTARGSITSMKTPTT